MKIALAAAIARLHAWAVNGERFPLELDVVTDTRALRPGQTYLALRGERFDGHAFTGAAVAAGAAGVIVADRAAIPADAPGLVVEETLRAYMALAGLAREMFEGTVIALTGSAGKTTTKAFIAQLLEAVFPGRVHATPENENNEIGVSKLLLSLRADHHFAVVEMGARHYGDIAPLVEIARPHVALLTNIGEAHLEIMGSRERLAETKWQIFGSGALPVVNLDDPISMERARSLARRPHLFGVHAAWPPAVREKFVRAVFARNDRSIYVVDGSASAEPVRLGAVSEAIVGRHNLANAVAAIAAVLAAGITQDTVSEHVGVLRLPAGRYERIALPGVQIIYDAYNASPDGMLATLAAFSTEHGARRIAVLASMAELGEAAPRLHRNVGIAASHAALDVVLIGGEHVDDLEAGLREESFPADRIVRFTSNEEAARWLRDHARPDDVVLLKGARRYKLEEVLELLREPVTP